MVIRFVRSQLLLRATRRICAAAALILAAGLSSTSAGGLDQFAGVWDAPSRYFPGHYFEQKAQFYLKKQDYHEALRLFELSGYWADKVSQYNAGIMYFNGIGVATDKARGAAWLGIAAEAHDTLAMKALQAAYAELSVGQRAEANADFDEINAKYGDDVALPRAMRRFQQDAAVSLFGFGVPGPGSVYTAGGPGGLEENSVSFVHRMDTQREALIAQITGHVTVGAVKTLDVPESAKRDASHALLQQPAGQP